MIREANIGDLKDLLELAAEFHKAARFKRLASFQESKSSWESWLSFCITTSYAACFVIEKENKLVGFVTAIKSPAYWNPDISYARETALWVSVKHRGKGAGSALLDAVSKWARTSGCQIVAAGSTVFMSPKEMGRLLRKHGFQLEERVYSKRSG